MTDKIADSIAYTQTSKEELIERLESIRDDKLRSGTPSRNSDAYKMGFRYAFELAIQQIRNYMEEPSDV